MRRWPQLRAGLIAIAIGFGLIDGCPVPPRGEPTAGMALGSLVAPVRAIQQVLEWPVAWIRPALRITQRWAVYQSPKSDRYRMSVEGEGATGAWRILYRAADPEHAEDADVIEHARVWGTWDPIDHVAMQYAAFGSWITGRMLAEHAELVAARIRMEKIVLHAGGFDPTGQYVFTYVRQRSKP